VSKETRSMLNINISNNHLPSFILRRLSFRL